MENEFERLTQPRRSAETIYIPDELKEIVAMRPESRPAIEELYKIRGYTVPHCVDVAHCTLKIADHLKLDKNQTSDLVLSGLLHDVGKEGVDKEIIEKSQKLTDKEREEINQHARISFQMLNNAMPAVAAIVAAHHEFQDEVPNGHRNGSDRRNTENGLLRPVVERRNGSRRVDDRHTQQAAEILALIDQFHSSIDPRRPYRKAVSIEEAINEKRLDSHFSESTKALIDVIADHYRRDLNDVSTTM
jgi:putative nucleotidyltransferase with HDIG domain